MISPPRTPRRNGRWATVLLVATAAFLLGAGAVGWLAWQSGLSLSALAGWHERPGLTPAPAAMTAASGPPSPAPAALAQSEGAIETRVAALEQRLARLDLETAAASGNAARAEGLLVAFAARRVIDRGAVLGYLEDQLKLRFGDAQPNAVAAIIAAARDPVTLDTLGAKLEAMAPQLATAPRDETTWSRLQREIGALFVIHRDEPRGASADARIDHARLCLHEGRIDDAIADIQRLPGAADAAGWIASARRYEDTQRALDVIETTALLEPRELRDGAGRRVDQPSPLQPVR